jgi:hypothetical protein
MTSIVRELQYIEEGLRALQQSVIRGETENATFILDNLLTGTARLIESCKIQRKRPVEIPDHDEPTRRMR